MSEIYVIVDVTGLTPDQIRAKQLAHNAIEGVDNPELLARIYGKIEDVNARLESFIDPAKLSASIKASLKFPSVEFNLEHRVVLITFMPTERDAFDKAMQTITKHFGFSQIDEVWFAQLGGYEKFKAATQKIEKALDVRAVGTILDKMAEIVMEQLKDDGEAGREREAPPGV